MKYLTACFWQQGDNSSSLLLQQFSWRETPLLFSCVCAAGPQSGAEGGYMTERLFGWFRSLNLKRLAERPERELEGAGKSLARVIAGADKEWAEARGGRGDETALSGILCAGECFLLFYRGRQRIYLVNTCFGRPHIKRLDRAGENRAGEKGAVMERGSLQPGLGLLFATESFCGGFLERTLREALSVREVGTRERLEKHLKELGEEAVRGGAGNAAAVFVRTDAGEGPGLSG